MSQMMEGFGQGLVHAKAWCVVPYVRDLAGKEKKKRWGRGEEGKRGRACVVVLGDLGRSPWMQYHALSLARQASLKVDIVAYGGILFYIQWPKHSHILPKMLYPLMLLLKPIIQFIMLLWFLCIKVPPPDAFIVQMVNGSLCVTRAMQHELAQNWGIKATVLYDQPPEFFRPTLLEEKHKLFCRLNRYLCHPLGVQACASAAIIGIGADDQNETLFTTQVGTGILSKPKQAGSCCKQYKLVRPSFMKVLFFMTPDEDFGILLEAAVMYDRRVATLLDENDSTAEGVLWKENSGGKQYLYPRLLFIITGPEKEKYEEKIERLNLKRVAFRTMWLSAEDYPLLLGSADLGVCLHSSSGLDLPMKPSLKLVLASSGGYVRLWASCMRCFLLLVNFSSTNLLKLKKMDCFSSSSELTDELLMLFRGFPDECDALKSLKYGGCIRNGFFSKVGHRVGRTC
ncbi:hypothetical protein CRYUN_Cryun17cG0068700 [Craigia yunnanensis]